MFVVMVEFPVEPERSDEVVATVGGLLESLASRQEGFVDARLHREVGGGKVVNYVRWRSREDFERFRALHKDRITAAFAPFGPKFSFYDIVREVAQA